MKKERGQGAVRSGAGPYTGRATRQRGTHTDLQYFNCMIDVNYLLTYILPSRSPVKIASQKKASEKFKSDLSQIEKVATGDRSVDVFFFNLGAMADLPYIEKMYAACVVADYILRQMVTTATIGQNR